MAENTSYFPIRIKLVDSEETKIVRDPIDLPNGVAFKVIQTCVREPGLLVPEKTAFPIRVKYHDTGEEVVYNTLSEITSFDEFTVIGRNVQEIPRMVDVKTVITREGCEVTFPEDNSNSVSDEKDGNGIPNVRDRETLRRYLNSSERGVCINLIGKIKHVHLDTFYVELPGDYKINVILSPRKRKEMFLKKNDDIVSVRVEILELKDLILF